MAKKSKVKEVKKFTPAKRATMERLLSQGWSVYSIAKELKLTPSVARYHAKRMQNSAKKVRAVVEPLSKKESNALTITEAILEIESRILSATEALNNMYAARALMESLVK